MTIARVIAGRSRSSIATAPGNITVQQAISQLAERRIGAMPIVADGRIVGMFSERDALYNLASDGADALSRLVSDVMTPEPITVDPDTTVLSALSLMTRRRIRHLPVLEHGEMIGIVSIGDLVKYRIDSIEREAEAMRSYIQAV